MDEVSEEASSPLLEKGEELSSLLLDEEEGSSELEDELDGDLSEELLTVDSLLPEESDESEEVAELDSEALWEEELG